MKLINKRIVLNVPLLEYYDELLKTYKGVVFLVHGHTGNKEFYDLQSLPLGFMNRGYFVVSIDAYKHGERIEEPYLTKSSTEITLAMPEVIHHTIQDILDLFESVYSRISKTLIVSGTSMGGHIAFLIPKYYEEVTAIFPIIGTPDFRSHYYETKRAFLGEKIRLCREQVESLAITELRPYLDTVIGIYNGSEDPIVEVQYVRPFYHELLRKDHIHLEMKEYPVGHQVTEEMIHDLFDFFDKEMA